MPEEQKPEKPVKLNYPGNSHKERDTPDKPEGRKPLEKIITGEAAQKKKTLGQKIAETFTGDDAQSVGSYILFDVVIPTVKTMISEAVSQGAERLLFGDSSRRSLGNRRPQQHTSYNKMYTARSEPSRSEGRSISQRGRATHDFDEIVLESRGDAETVLDRLGDLIADYDVATVSDLYDLVGITGSFTDDKWGWFDLRGASVTRVRAGYLLNLPKTAPID